MAGIILIVGVILMIVLRVFRDAVPPAGYRWARLTIAVVMLIALAAGVAADYRERRRRRLAEGSVPR